MFGRFKFGVFKKIHKVLAGSGQHLKDIFKTVQASIVGVGNIFFVIACIGVEGTHHQYFRIAVQSRLHGFFLHYWSSIRRASAALFHGENFLDHVAFAQKNDLRLEGFCFFRRHLCVGNDDDLVAAALAQAIEGIAGLDRTRLLLFGGWESASRGAGTTMQAVAERLGIIDQFQGVDELQAQSDGRMRILERIEGGKHQVSILEGPPALLGWATGNLGEPPNNPQIGMQNMRAIMPSLQKAKPVQLAAGASFASVALPKQQRDTRIVKNMAPDDVAKEIAEWILGEAR